MNKKLKSILLIDDNEAINFINEKIIRIINCSESVVVKKNGLDALHYLTTEVHGKLPKPEIIFLDINMPVMDGWTFLEEYAKLPQERKSELVLIMLTTSLNPDDEERALAIPDVKGFQRKPLTPEILQDILDQYFEKKN